MRPQLRPREQTAEIFVTGLRFDQDGETEDAIRGGRSEGRGADGIVQPIAARGGDRSSLLARSPLLAPRSPLLAPRSSDCQLGSDDRFDAGFLRRDVEARRAVNAVAIEERERRIPERRGALNQRFGQRCAVEKGKRG